MSKPFKHDPQWARAKRICRLNQDDIRMAKELGMSPKTLMKNNPSPSQRWKLPVKCWIRELHEKRFGRKPIAPPAPAPALPPDAPVEAEAGVGDCDDNVPF